MPFRQARRRPDDALERPATQSIHSKVQTVMIRDDVKAATITAMKAKEKERTNSKEIDDDAMVTSVLQKMAKQRRESIEMYQTGGRDELAAKEQSELEIIEEFLPQMMSEEETKTAIDAIKEETGASSMKDMGTVMGQLKAKHGAVLDGKLASGLVKAALS